MITGKILKRRGWEQGRAIGLAKAAAAALADADAGLDRDAILAQLDAVRKDPAAYLDDPILGPLATELDRRAREPVFAGVRLTSERAEVSQLHAEPIPYRTWGAEGIEPAARAQMETAMRLPVSVAGALMPDAHVGYGLPIGGVLATQEAVIPYAVGVDIACRMRLSIYPENPDVLDRNPERYTQALLRKTYFGAGKKNPDRPHHEVLDDPTWDETKLLRSLHPLAAQQLGTSGSGNHFVEWGAIELEEPDPRLGLEPGRYLALLSHSGSRGVGFKIANAYSQIAMDKHRSLDRSVRQLAWLPLLGESGQEYWLSMELAGRFASANHYVIHHAVAKAAGLEEMAVVENHHNFCIPGSAYIPTTRGPKRMEDIVSGDHVYAMGHEGLVPTKVVRHWLTATKPIFAIRTRHRSLRCSSDHPVLTVRRSKEADFPGRVKYHARLEWRRAESLVEGDMVVCGEGYRGVDEDGITPDKARLLGAFTGDGWRRHDTVRRGHSVGVAIGAPGEHHTQKYLALVGRELPPAKWRDNAPGAFGITCSSRAVARELIPLGVLERSRDKAVPPVIFSASRDARLAFLAGCADADGSVAVASNYSHGRITFCATNESLIRQVRELAISCGLQVTNVTRSSTRMTNFATTSEWSWRFALDAASASEIPLWHDRKVKNLAAPSRHERRGLTHQYTGRLDLPAGLFVERITGIERQEAEPVYDIEVEHPTHSFVCEGVVVHNCWKEEVDGRELLVHRKGATPAGSGVLGVIPGSMGDPGFVVRGRGVPDSLDSAAHGAGRAMGRKAAIQSIAKEERDRYLKERGVTLLGGGIDEAPQAYKCIDQVIAAQKDLVDILGTFRPRIVRMATESRDI